ELLPSIPKMDLTSNCNGFLFGGREVVSQMGFALKGYVTYIHSIRIKHILKYIHISGTSRVEDLCLKFHQEYDRNLRVNNIPTNDVLEISSLTFFIVTYF
ncbi:hypothetical protein L9F63_011825, partial [Diploptera punctata]